MLKQRGKGGLDNMSGVGGLWGFVLVMLWGGGLSFGFGRAGSRWVGGRGRGGRFFYGRYGITFVVYVRGMGSFVNFARTGCFVEADRSGRRRCVFV